MTTKSIVIIGSIALFAIILFFQIVSLNNREVVLRTQIEAKMQDNEQQLANMKNKFRETGMVSNKEIELLSSVFVNYAAARSSGGGGKLATFVTEAIPNVKPETLNRLMNIIEAGRNAWTSRQTELIDYNREHKNLLRQFPANILFSILGRQEIEIVVVSSSEAKEAFATGKEEATEIFK